MSEQILWENKKEILPIMNDKKIAVALVKFLGGSQQHLKEVLNIRLQETSDAMVELRGEEKEKKVSHGYYSFSIPKGNDLNEFRTISAPYTGLKALQSSLLTTLRQIPVSHATQGGELGTSPKKNALFHRPNAYLYTTDVKSAYPSVSAQRVYKNLQGGLNKYLDISFPHLSETQREAFFNVLTTLTTHNNALPQGAPTSARLLNIVMAKTDSELLRWLHAEDSPVVNPIYTRYIDDAAFSFSRFASFDHFAQQGKVVVNKVTALVESYDSGLQSAEAVEQYATEIERFLETPYEIADVISKDRIRNCYLLVKKQLEIARDHTKTLAGGPLYARLYALIGIIDAKVSVLNTASDQAAFTTFQGQVQKIMNANGRTLKHEKDKIWMPGASTVKEITGVMIGPDGRIGISQEKMEGYVTLARTATLFPSQVNKKFLQADGFIDSVQLAYVLHGIRNFIADVKGHVPECFDRRFLGAQAKHFPKIKVAKNVQSMQGVSNGNIPSQMPVTSL